MAGNSVGSYLRCLIGSYKQVNFIRPLRGKPINNKECIYKKYHDKCLSYFNQINPSCSFSVHNRSEAVSVRNKSTATFKNMQRNDEGCPVCSRNVTFTYKDVLLLSQFVSSEGNILNRRITGVCRKQQRKLEKAIEISRRLGLIPRKPPLLHKRDKM